MNDGVLSQKLTECRRSTGTPASTRGLRYAKQTAVPVYDLEDHIKFDSMGLFIHGLAKKGARLAENHRAPYAQVQAIVDTAKNHKNKTLICCESPPHHSKVRQSFISFTTPVWNDEKCTLTITPAQIGYTAVQNDEGR